ncbi:MULTISPECIES: hypothetical protein [Flavobacterium]|uniref:hypothetical protein n=1 Tax=Flavobacterium TaxID=237 RepID=UPI001FCC12F8|nr:MULTISPECIES: hypothetical protein [Flavobacterium]UOK41137.1 hypothetical protein LZF87_07325 [Flavobacterium enshiense]
MNHLFVAILAIFLFSTDIGYSQSDSIKYNSKDIRDIYKKIFVKNDSINKFKDKRIAFSLFPSPAGSDAGGGFVISFLTTFYLGEDTKNTRMSEVIFTPYFSLDGQYVFPITTYLYTNRNIYNFTGDYRYMIYPQPTYGLGNNNSETEISRLEYKQWRFYQFATRKVAGNFRMGLGVLFDSYEGISEESFIEGETDYVKYMKGDFSNVSSFGIALQLLYDSRINVINPEQGFYAELDYRNNFNGGLDNQDWKSIYVDLRKYYSLHKKLHRVLAGRFFYWSTFWGDPHYLDLPSIGWDRFGKTGRGFTRNRFRSNGLLYFESEYRTDITRDGFFGAVFFANVSSVSKLYTSEFTKWHPAVGTGLRVKWNKKNNNNVTLDFGVSKNDWSLRVSLAENF